MSICANELVADCDESYWADGKAAVPVLLLDEATEAITEAVHRIRRGSVLEQRDVAATGVALGDLFGGLSQLVELCTTLMDQDARTEPVRIGRLADRWQTLRIMMLSAQQVTDELVSRNGGHFTRHSQISAGQRLIGTRQACKGSRIT